MIMILKMFEITMMMDGGVQCGVVNPSWSGFKINYYYDTVDDDNVGDVDKYNDIVDDDDDDNVVQCGVVNPSWSGG